MGVLARKLLEVPLAGALRNKLALHHAQRDLEGSSMMASRLGLPLLNVNERILWPNRSDTLFILGSGASVEELSVEHFAQIDAHTSVGINSWVIHDFIADAYCFEEVESDEYHDVRDALTQMLERPDILERRPAIFLLRPHARTPPRRIIDIPGILRLKSRVYGRVSPVTSNVTNLEKDLVRMLGCYAKGELSPSLLVDAGMSVARMMTLGGLSGFSKIVLVGVDLNSSEYFFDINPDYLAKRGIAEFNPWKRRGAIHDTEDRNENQFVASQFLPALRTAMHKTWGTEIYVGSPRSALMGDFPLYPWGIS